MPMLLILMRKEALIGLYCYSDEEGSADRPVLLLLMRKEALIGLCCYY